MAPTTATRSAQSRFRRWREPFLMNFLPAWVKEYTAFTSSRKIPPRRTTHADELQPDFSTLIHRQESICTGKSPKFFSASQSLLAALWGLHRYFPYSSVNVRATVEVTAHSRDVLEFNLRRPWLLAAVKAQSHPVKDERERNSPDCQNAAPATGGGRTSTPLTRSVWLVQAGFISC